MLTNPSWACVIHSGDLQLPSPSSVPPRPSEPRQQQEREAEKRSSPPERRRDEPPGPSPARRNDARPTEPREGSHHLPSRRGEDERPSRREESRVRRSRSPPAASTRRRSRSRDAPPRPTSPLKMPMLCRHGILCRHHESNSCRYVHEDEKDLLRKFFGSVSESPSMAHQLPAPPPSFLPSTSGHSTIQTPPDWLIPSSSSSGPGLPQARAEGASQPPLGVRHAGGVLPRDGAAPRHRRERVGVAHGRLPPRRCKGVEPSRLLGQDQPG